MTQIVPGAETLRDKGRLVKMVPCGPQEAAWLFFQLIRVFISSMYLLCEEFRGDMEIRGWVWGFCTAPVKGRWLGLCGNNGHHERACWEGWLWSYGRYNLRALWIWETGQIKEYTASINGKFCLIDEWSSQQWESSNLSHGQMVFKKPSSHWLFL